MIKRFYNPRKIRSLLEPNRVLVLYGPRRVGKTTILKQLTKNYKGKYLFTTGEDRQFSDILRTSSVETIRTYFSGYPLLIVDEAQKAPSIGQGLKLIVDHVPNIRVLATGSSSFDLANQIGEPLTGRQNIIKLYPLSVLELLSAWGRFDLQALQENLLIFGSYPEVLTSNNANKKIEYLNTLADSYLYKDILEIVDIRNSAKLRDLLRLLAFQIGQEVSINELATSLGMSKLTVERYLDLLEKSFVIINIRGFSKNLRKEVTKTSRYYFWDNGIRNAIIQNFNMLPLRNDVGQLWENFLMIERFKTREYKNIHANSYFWRTYDRKEIDLIEERDGRLYGYEFKWKEKKQKVPKEWKEAYEQSEYSVITNQNYLEFLT